MITVEEMQRRIQELPEALTRGSWQKLTAAAREELERTINAGKTPDGVPWAKRKRGTGAVLVNAAAALKVATIQNVIWMRLTGPEARHHRGAVKGGVTREIILTHLTDTMATVIHDVLTKAFSETVSGA
jgi:cytochrome P450